MILEYKTGGSKAAVSLFSGNDNTGQLGPIFKHGIVSVMRPMALLMQNTLKLCGNYGNGSLNGFGSVEFIDSNNKKFKRKPEDPC